MRNYVISSIIKSIKKNSNYKEEDLEKIEYGLLSIYMTLTKIVVILLVSVILNIFKETIIIMLLFNIIRFTAFGLHAKKSWMCWISSIITFIVLPIICKYIEFNMTVLFIITILSITIFLLYAPSDTINRPIINKKRRLIYKISSIIISISYLVTILLIDDYFIKNALAFSLLIESILILPVTYKLFKLPYNNYISYMREMEEQQG